MNKRLLMGSWLLCFSIMSCEKETMVNEPGNLVPKTVDQDPSLPQIKLNGIGFHTRAFGPVDSPLVITLHGGPGSNYRYLLNCATLADSGYRVVFYDQRGSGLTQRLPKKWYTGWGENGLDKMFYEDLRAIISHYKTHPTQKVILLGHSWGAIMATGYAAKFPNEVNGLILAEPGGFVWDDIVSYVNKSRSYGLWSEALNDITYLDQFMSARQDQHQIADYKVYIASASNSIVGDLYPTLNGNERWYLSPRDGAIVNIAAFEWATKYKPDFSKGIDKYTRKMLFLYSSNNKAYPDTWANRIASVYPNKEVNKISGVGHSGMFDQQDSWKTVTQNLVIKYLRGL
jgi:proline iminopeptidase